ncbi:MAG: GC-type dockerin domain-anchored protein [Phycisphaerales bacterium JB060]
MCTGAPLACSAGAVYAHQRFDGQWVRTQIVLPLDIGFGDNFGTLSLDGDRMLVSTMRHDLLPSQGRGHIFEFTGEEWVETSRLLPPADAPDLGLYGTTVALLGGTALVRHYDRIYHYEENAEGWGLEQVLLRPDGVESSDNFGFRIKISDEWVFICAVYDGAHMTRSRARHGSVFVYRRSPDGSLEYTQKLLPPDLDGEHDAYWMHFGTAMDYDGRTLMVSAGHADRTFEDQGVVFAYELDGDRWTLRQEITASGARERHGFGFGLGMGNGVLIVGTQDVRHNVVYVYHRMADGSWREVAIMEPGAAAPAVPGYFGKTVAIEGDTAMIGAPEEGVPGFPAIFIGAAYAFDLSCEVCPADLDADGALTVFDYLTYLNLFQDGDAQADFDGDGALTIFDFLAFQTAFDAGC